MFRGETEILVYRPHVYIPVSPSQAQIVNNIGGFIGIGSSVSRANIVLEKNYFITGEVARATI